MKVVPGVNGKSAMEKPRPSLGVQGREEGKQQCFLPGLIFTSRGGISGVASQGSLGTDL